MVQISPTVRMASTALTRTGHIHSFRATTARFTARESLLISSRPSPSIRHSDVRRFSDKPPPNSIPGQFESSKADKAGRNQTTNGNPSAHPSDREPGTTSPPPPKLEVEDKPRFHNIWRSMTIWPKELRSDLRQGLLEDLRGNREISAQYLYRAWKEAKDMPIDKFGYHPYLKVSGIAIALAGVLEADGKAENAYHIYQEALQVLQVEGSDSPTARIRSGLSPPERMRAVAIAYKLGELAHALGKPKEEEEKWLVYSVESVLKDVMGSSEADFEPKEGAAQLKELMETLRTPRWAVKHDIAAPFEALGAFYSREGKIIYAMPLYLQAISILMPPPPQSTTAEDQCRAAQLMGNISELILRTKNDPESLVQAEAWANKGLEIASRVRKGSFTTHPVCEVAYACMLFNLGMIREMSGDQTKARELFTQSLDQSRIIGLHEGIENAEKAIHELGRETSTPTISSA
ncbi:hypothetical protein DFP72DRAFT_870869 [Ephemerocybe angulata]|uniref:Uncharacterized protein n=1 Tax=Ephemerocybe angulata TaxID=980116 RepID=A0A8H6IGR7_9AGAR|nr:hypothetical protein DFP72DRAFT_870869 [Tulosesus angulatus]